MSRWLIGTFDVVLNKRVAVEIDPAIPRFYKRVPAREPPERTPDLCGFTPEGNPILYYGYLACDFERELLEAFQSAFLSEPRP